MKVEMLVRRVVDGRVELSVEMVDTTVSKGDTECVNPGRLTALAVASRSTRCTNSSTTDGLTAVEAVSSLKHTESISTS